MISDAKIELQSNLFWQRSSERDAEATLAHARTRPHDTFSHFAILACVFWLSQHEVGSFEFKVYLTSIFGYLGIFSAEESHLSLTICPRHRAEFGIRWRCSKVKCSVPAQIAAHKTATAKGDRRLESAQSAFLLKSTGELVQVGSRKFT